MYGETGAGWLEKIGLQERVDIVSGSSGKAVGLHGGYIAGDKEVVDALEVYPLYIPQMLSSVIRAGALASVGHPKDDGGKELRRPTKKKQWNLKHY